MSLLPVIFNLITNLLFIGHVPHTEPDPCAASQAAVAAANMIAKDSSFLLALQQVRNAYQEDLNEHAVSFGKDAAGRITASEISNGSNNSGKVPVIANAFADLHNHPNDLPPDAGDFYGLAKMNTGKPHYKTRFVVTANGTLYALLITDAAALQRFLTRYPPQPPAYAGGPKGFAVAITDEGREMKYNRHCSDEMVLAFILEKYNTGLCLLKQNSQGSLVRLSTRITKKEGKQQYSMGSCE